MYFHHLLGNNISGFVCRFVHECVFNGWSYTCDVSSDERVCAGKDEDVCKLEEKTHHVDGNKSNFMSSTLYNVHEICFRWFGGVCDANRREENNFYFYFHTYQMRI